MKEATDADIVRIDTVVPYAGSYNDVVDQGQREVQCSYEPEIKPLCVNPKDYDMIAVGTPTWWYTMAPAILTFLHSQDWSDKTVVPFMTNGGWPGHVIKDIKHTCVGAEIKEPLEVRFDSNGGNRMETPETEVAAWVQRVKALL